MKKLKLKKILLLFSMVLAMVGCFLVTSVGVKASDDLIFSVDEVGYSDKSNIVYTEYCEAIDKVVCVTNNSSICFLDYNSFKYSDEISINEIPTTISESRCTICDYYLIIVYQDSTNNNNLSFIKIDLKTLEYSIHLTSYSVSRYSIHSKNDLSFYLNVYNSSDYIKTILIETMTEISSLYLEGNTNGRNIAYADSNYICMSSFSDYYNGYIYKFNELTKLVSTPMTKKAYKIDKLIFFTPLYYSGDKSGVYFKYYDIQNNKVTVTNYKPINESYQYATFFVDNKIYMLPMKNLGVIEVFTINDFQLEGDNILFTDINSPLSYQDILSQYTPSDKYGRSLMTSIKADSYYNSFSTPGNYDATITVSDGYCHEDFAITIVVNKGGGEEEKKESSGSTIKWDTNLMIQSFGGIAVFLVIGLLVVSIIKKILR